MPREAPALLRRIAGSNVLRLAGAYAHLHGYDPATGNDYARRQFRKFQTVMAEAASCGDEVVFPGAQDAEAITIDQLTECWEIDGLDFLGGMRDHIRRIYFRNGA